MSEPEQAVMETKSEEVGSTEVVKVRRKRRPARVQVDPSTVTEEDRPPQIGTVFNIWYLKWYVLLNSFGTRRVLLTNI